MIESSQNRKEVNSHFWCRINKISMIVTEMVAAVVEERLLVPQRRDVSATVEGKGMLRT